MTRNQKVVLIVLAILDVLVVGGIAAFILTSMGDAPAGQPLPTLMVAEGRETAVPTWTPTVTSTPRPTLPPQLTNTPRPTNTPFPTATPTPLPTPGPVELVNADFDMLMPNRIPGWQWDAYVNYQPGDEYDPQESFAEPLFEAADDPVRRINGSTLKIETIRWLKYQAWVYQTVSVTTGSSVYFQVKANAYSSIDEIIMGAGVDPRGGEGCDGAEWNRVTINQDDGVVTITSPRVTVREKGAVTACLYAEPRYPDVNNAAFFDQAELIASPPR